MEIIDKRFRTLKRRDQMAVGQTFSIDKRLYMAISLVSHPDASSYLESNSIRLDNGGLHYLEPGTYVQPCKCSITIEANDA